MNKESSEINDLGAVLLHIAVLLMGAGASTERVRLTVQRISDAFGFRTDMFITHQAIQIHVSSAQQNQTYYHLRRSFDYINNFSLLTSISQLSWKVVEEKWTIERFRNEVDQLVNIEFYPRWQVLFLVAFAGTSFCRLFGGGFMAMLATFITTLGGQMVHQQLGRLRLNPLLRIYLTATFTAGLGLLFCNMPLGVDREHSLPASLLFMIPGIPMLNSFSDFIDGNILNGIVRSINGLSIALSIALGFLTVLMLVP